MPAKAKVATYRLEDPCPTCDGHGRVPRVSQGFRIEWRYQDCTEINGPYADLAAAKSHVRKYAKVDKSARPTIIGPDGQIH
jgi:hypothetical protein